MDIYEANRKAWNNESSRGNFWTLMVKDEQIRKAREGRPEIWVTPFRSVPLDWISGLKDQSTLLACSGGGQQTPILAAFGANVTALDISDSQISQDRAALEKYGLNANLVRANVLEMPFEDSSFQAVIMPQAMNFIDDLEKLYTEVKRVLRSTGVFIFGTANPILYLFDERIQSRKLKVRYTIPFSHTRSLSPKALSLRLSKNDTLEFSHTLDTILGLLTQKGFAVTGFYTDSAGSEPTDSFVHDSHLAVRAVLA